MSGDKIAVATILPVSLQGVPALVRDLVAVALAGLVQKALERATCTCGTPECRALFKCEADFCDEQKRTAFATGVAAVLFELAADQPGQPDFFGMGLQAGIAAAAKGKSS